MTETALELFIRKMNETSEFWTKNIEVTARHGKIIIVKCEGFSFTTNEQSDLKELEQ